MEGEGTYAYKDGTKYTGQWIDNKKHGMGTFYNGAEAYRGQWKENIK